MKLQQAPGGTATECRAFTSSGDSYEEAPGLQKHTVVGSVKKNKRKETGKCDKQAKFPGL